MTTYLPLGTAFDSVGSVPPLPPPPPPPPPYRRVRLVQEPEHTQHDQPGVWAKAVRLRNAVRGWVQAKLIGQKYEHAWIWLLMFFVYVSVVVMMFTRIHARLGSIETYLRELTMASARATLFRAP